MMAVVLVSDYQSQMESQQCMEESCCCPAALTWEGCISRGVESATLITDDAKELKENVEERTGVRMTALEAWLESQRADDRDDRRADQVNNRDRERAAEKDPAKDPQKDRENHKQAQLELPGLVKEKLEEMEKQVELIRERSRELER